MSKTQAKVMFKSIMRPASEKIEVDIPIAEEPSRMINGLVQDSSISTSTAKRPSIELFNNMATRDLLFDFIKDTSGDHLPVSRFWASLKEVGIGPTDPRLEHTRQALKKLYRFTGRNIDETDNTYMMDRETFKDVIEENVAIIMKLFKNDVVIPDFKDFTGHIDDIFEKCATNTNGKVPAIISQLSRADPNNWGVAICTTDGQRYSRGESNIPFCIHSSCKAVNYALAVSDLGHDKVHQYIGQEPSGQTFNELTLDSNNKPHNPMINAGAIVTTSLLKPHLQMADRFDYVFNQYKRLAGGEHIGFSNATYLAEREVADRNFALGYYMREYNCFPEGTDLLPTLEFFFSLCSVEITAESGSVIAGTLAHGGICPMTGERVLAREAVRNTLALMHSCGMYDYSGQFAFKVGLPAKSGGAGCILLVVPNVMGICTWCPALDEMGNSCRGVQFCEELVSRFNFHNYDAVNHTFQKLDPRRRRLDSEANTVMNLLTGAANGDFTAISRFKMTGMDIAAADYDGRTALHLACAEGHLHVVRLLLEKCHVPFAPRDRWGFTPLDDAKRFEHGDIVLYMEDFKKKMDRGTLIREESTTSLKSLMTLSSPTY